MLCIRLKSHYCCSSAACSHLFMCLKLFQKLSYLYWNQHSRMHLGYILVVDGTLWEAWNIVGGSFDKILGDII